MNGFINVNKVSGVSSAREVNVIKRLSHTPCGHLGTLDPMANGVLPIAIGNASRLFDYFLTKRKTYIATFRFGENFDTLDTTGTVISDGGRIPSEKELIDVIPSLVGEVMQVPPRYSAKSIGGKRGYRLAREGVDFQLPPQKVNIYSIRYLGRAEEDSFSFEIVCGGGTYIRSIGRDLAAMLSTYAAMSSLTRTESGPFKIDNSVVTEQLDENNIKDYIIPTDSVLPFESIYAEGENAKKLFNGIALKSDLPDGTYKIYNGKEVFYGLATVDGGLLKVRKKLC